VGVWSEKGICLNRREFAARDDAGTPATLPIHPHQPGPMWVDARRRRADRDPACVKRVAIVAGPAIGLQRHKRSEKAKRRSTGAGQRANSVARVRHSCEAG